MGKKKRGQAEEEELRSIVNPINQLSAEEERSGTQEAFITHIHTHTVCVYVCSLSTTARHQNNQLAKFSRQTATHVAS